MTGHAVYDFPFGLLYVGYEDDVVIALRKVRTAADRGVRTPLSDAVCGQVMEYLEGKRTAFDFAYRLDGTDFQKKVWAQLLQIPYGETRTYQQVAQAVGNPKACRAVGMANNRNPVALAVPCHRVVGKNGALVGYAGGTDMKEALLKLEREHRVARHGEREGTL